LGSDLCVALAGAINHPLTSGIAYLQTGYPINRGSAEVSEAGKNDIASSRLEFETNLAAYGTDLAAFAFPELDPFR
jgi:hypothetical protein